MDETVRFEHSHRPRLLYLDCVRAFATVLIVITHFNNPFLEDRAIFTNSPFGIYIGSWGVSLFLIVSGASLMYAHGSEEKLDLNRFFFKRFKSIYPMYWIAFILANSYLFLLHGGHVYSNSPRWHAIFSVFAVDGYLANFGVATFYTLGEWFLGFIIIFYFVFPILRYGVSRYPKITLVIILSLYFLTIFWPPSQRYIPRDILLTSRLPELTFGMYFIQYFPKPNPVAAVVSVLVLVVQQLFKPVTGIPAVTVVGICTFIAIAFLWRFVDTALNSRIVKTVSHYSYPIFLIHHQVIIQVFSKISISGLSSFDLYILFFVDTLIILFLAFYLDVLTRRFLLFFTRDSGGIES